MAKKIEDLDRAKIFMPFDALQGLKQELSASEIVVEKKIDLMDEDLQKLNQILCQIKKHDLVRIKFYNGTNYQTFEGEIFNIDSVYKSLKVDDKVIDFENILSLEKI